MPIKDNYKQYSLWAGVILASNGTGATIGTFFGAPDRCTGSDCKALELRIRRVELKVESLPPSELTADVEVLKEKLRYLDKASHWHGKEYVK